MSRPETVEVPVALLDALAGEYARNPQPGSTDPIDLIVALRPAPEWEPTEEQVKAYIVERHPGSIRREGEDAADLKAAAKVLGVDQ